MPKKLINRLVSLSYKKNIVDAKNVDRIVKFLSIKDLKHYIEALKKQEKKLAVFIDVPMNGLVFKKEFSRIFPNKKITWKIVPSLMLGTRIIENDMLFEMNLKNTLDKIKSSIEQNYD